MHTVLAFLARVLVLSHKHMAAQTACMCSLAAVHFWLSSAALVPTKAFPVQLAVGPVHVPPISHNKSVLISVILALFIIILTIISTRPAPRCRPRAGALVRSHGCRQVGRAGGRPAPPGQAA
jgi:hypothetical protein